MVNNISNRSHTVHRSILLHPLTIFTAVWSGVAFLYSLHLSNLLLFDDKEVRQLILDIILPFIAACGLTITVCAVVQRGCRLCRRNTIENFGRLDRRLSVLFRLWVVATLLEIAISGGVPLLWVLRGSAKTYFDFGIPSVHGLLNSLVEAIAVSRVAMFVLTRQKRHLVIPAFVILWSVVVMTRNMMIVVLLEAAIVWLSFCRIKLFTMGRIVAGTIVFILAFGAIGDVRSGADHFRALAQPTDNYPDWMPSGVLWGYIYLTTPVNNLLHTMGTARVEKNILFPNTSALLFPTVLRKAIYGKQWFEAESGDLVTQAFNVSTAYASPYQDWGNVGMTLYSVLIGVISAFYWRCKTVRDALIYAILGQCLILTVFFNHFFDLPVITQVAWVYLIFIDRKIRFAAHQQPALPAADPA